MLQGQAHRKTDNSGYFTFINTLSNFYLNTADYVPLAILPLLIAERTRIGIDSQNLIDIITRTVKC